MVRARARVSNCQHGALPLCLGILCALAIFLLCACDLSGLDRERAELLEEQRHLKEQIAHVEHLLAKIESREAKASLKYVDFILSRLGLKK